MAIFCTRLLASTSGVEALSWPVLFTLLLRPSHMSTVTFIAFTAVGVVLARAWLSARRNLQLIDDHVGWRLLIHPLIPVPLPDTPWINRGFGWVWKDKYTRVCYLGHV